MIGGMRSLLAFVAGLLASVLLPLALVSVWTDAVVNDTDEYVETVGPLAEDERVQEAVADRVADIAVARLGPATPRTVVEQAALRVVDTELFERTWRAANRAAHPQLIDLLRDGEGVRDDGEVTLDLAPMASATVEELGVSVPVDLSGDLSFTIARSEDLREARVAYAVVDPAGFWLPVAWLGCVALVLLVARRRRGAAIWLALGSAGGLAFFLLLLGIARAVFADSLPGADAELGGAVFDVVTDSLVALVVTGIVTAVVAAVVLALVGAVRSRSTP